MPLKATFSTQAYQQEDIALSLKSYNTGTGIFNGSLLIQNIINEYIWNTYNTAVDDCSQLSQWKGSHQSMLHVPQQVMDHFIGKHSSWIFYWLENFDWVVSHKLKRNSFESRRFPIAQRRAETGAPEICDCIKFEHKQPLAISSTNRGYLSESRGFWGKSFFKRQ